MQPIQFDANYCFMTKFTNLISGKWKPIILYLIENDINRFSQMFIVMSGISKKTLTEQLRSLESDGLIVREELKSKAPKVVVYQLSEKGRSYRKLIDEIITWGMTYMTEEVPYEMRKEYRVGLHSN